jgi:hypothetical protein
VNIIPLIRKGRVDPILQTDTHGTEMLVGWRRKGDSRKSGTFMLQKPMAWINREEIAAVQALTPGARIVFEERKRQIRSEGWTAEHDDGHLDGELSAAAGCYALTPEKRVLFTPSGGRGGTRPVGWPWDASSWKPSTDRIRDLAKAGALYLAESDRLKRAGDDAGALQIQALALGCAKQIDDLYRVGPLSPGDELLDLKS